VSIVIPCRNHARFLDEAIESVLAQTVPVRDLIVVDDGSTDDTPAVAARYPGLHYVRQSRRGVSAARNAGLRLANAEHIVFLDADDRLLPTACAVGLACLDADPSCAFSSGGVHIIGDSGAVITTPDNACADDDHYRTLLMHNYIWTPAAVMFRASALRRVSGYDARRSGAADWDLYLRIARQPFVRGRPEYEEIHRAGLRNTQRYYGDLLAAQIRQAMSTSSWGVVLRGVGILLTYYPQGLPRLFASDSPRLNQ
jgi:glycosyltransferase involved in cell wall biosynthesis